MTLSSTLYAISDLHLNHRANREWLEEAVSRTVRDDWLIVAGDLGDVAGAVVEALRGLSNQFRQVIWAPGNHDLWSRSSPRCAGPDQYGWLVEELRLLGVATPEDDPVEWIGATGAELVVPLFTLYDYTWGVRGLSGQAAIDAAVKADVLCTDEALILPGSYASLGEWGADRMKWTRERLAALGRGPKILVNHHPLDRRLVAPLRPKEFALWCGSNGTGSWPLEFNATTVVYGHLHIPRRTVIDGIDHVEVSLGYPSEWFRRKTRPQLQVIRNGA